MLEADIYRNDYIYPYDYIYIHIYLVYWVDFVIVNKIFGQLFFALPVQKKSPSHAFFCATATS